MDSLILGKEESSPHTLNLYFRKTNTLFRLAHNSPSLGKKTQFMFTVHTLVPIFRGQKVKLKSQTYIMHKMRGFLEFLLNATLAPIIYLPSFTFLASFNFAHWISLHKLLLHESTLLLVPSFDLFLFLVFHSSLHPCSCPISEQL